MERIYGRNGLVKYYPLRGRVFSHSFCNQLTVSTEPGEQAPPLVMHPSEESHGILPRAAGTSRALKRSYAMLGMLLDLTCARFN